MSATSNYNIGSTPILPGRSIIVNNMKCPTAEINNLSVNLINGLPPPSAPPIAAPVNSILTVTSPGIASFTDSAILNNLEVDGEISLDGDIGSSNKVISNTAGVPSWSLIGQSNFANATPNSSLATDGAGVVTFKKLPALNINPGSNGQCMITDSGIAKWGTCPTSGISPGSAYQVLQTNSTATNTEWSSTLGINSITFTNNIANFQSVFNRYYTEQVQLPLYAVSVGGSPSVYQNINVDAYFSVIGKRVELTIFPFKLASLFGGATAPCYLSMLIGPSYLRAANLLGLGNETQRQSSSLIMLSQNHVSQSAPGIANIYFNYYSTNASYIELTKGISSDFVDSAYHGDAFSAYPSNFMELQVPFTISYIGQ